MAAIPVFFGLFSLVSASFALGSLAVLLSPHSGKPSLSPPVAFANPQPRFFCPSQLCRSGKAHADGRVRAFAASPSSFQPAVSSVLSRLPAHPRGAVDVEAGRLTGRKQAPPGMNAPFTSATPSATLLASGDRGERNSDDIFQDFRAETVALFPGQGAQTLGELAFLL